MNGKFIYFKNVDETSELRSNSTSSDDGINSTWSNHSSSLVKIPFSSSTSNEDHPIVQALRIISEVWISFPLAILGIIGNLVSLFVLCKHRRRQKLRTIIILLRALAVVDTLVLFSVIVLRSLRYAGPLIYVVIHSRCYPYLYPTAYVLRLINTWMTVLLTVDRYVAVCRPLHAHSVCTVSRTYVQMTSVFVISVLFCIPRFFEYHIRYYEDGRYGFETTPLMMNHTYTVVYRILLFLFVHYFLPTVLLVWLNTRVIISLRRSDAYRTETIRRLQSYSLQLSGVGGGGVRPLSSSVTAFQSTRSLTIVVIVVVLMCIVCHLVAITAQVLWSLQVGFTDLRFHSVEFGLARRHISQASNVLVTLNSAANFVVYCLCSRSFRMVLADQLCCRWRAVGGGEGSSCWKAIGLAERPSRAIGHASPVRQQTSTNTTNSTRSALQQTAFFS